MWNFIVKALKEKVTEMTKEEVKEWLDKIGVKVEEVTDDLIAKVEEVTDDLIAKVEA